MVYSVIPACAEVQEVAVFGMFWIPAFAGMTVRCERLPKGDFGKARRGDIRRLRGGRDTCDNPAMVVSKLLTDDARQLAENWLRERMPAEVRDPLSLGLPEWDDRLAVWRVALVSRADLTCPVGEIQIDPDGVINRAPSRLWLGPDCVNLANAPSRAVVPATRELPFARSQQSDPRRLPHGAPRIPPEQRAIDIHFATLFQRQAGVRRVRGLSVVPEFLGEVFAACHSVLAEGRFLVVNVSPVLVRRTSRSTASKRLPIRLTCIPSLTASGLSSLTTLSGASRKAPAGIWVGADGLPPTVSRSSTSRLP